MHTSEAFEWKNIDNATSAAKVTEVDPTQTNPHATDEAIGTRTISIENHKPGADRSLQMEELFSVVVTIICLFAINHFLVDRLFSGTFGRHLLGLVVWCGLAAAFHSIVFAKFGEEGARQWLLGFVLEWPSSVNDIFVFHLVLKGMSMPTNLIPKALTFGILLALTFRALLAVFSAGLILIPGQFQIAIGVTVISWALWAFIFQDSEKDALDTLTVNGPERFCGRRFLNVYDQDFFVWYQGNICVSLLFFVVLSISFVDSLLAYNYVILKKQLIESFFFNMTSAAVAMLTLRAIFFTTVDLLNANKFVKYGITVCLCLVGLRLIIEQFLVVHSTMVFIVVYCFLCGSAVLACIICGVKWMASSMLQRYNDHLCGKKWGCGSCCVT